MVKFLYCPPLNKKVDMHYAHAPELMNDASWSPATRDMAEDCLRKIKEKPEKEAELRAAFNKFFCDNPECLF
jgi:hypothetical protein